MVRFRPRRWALHALGATALFLSALSFHLVDVHLHNIESLLPDNVNGLELESRNRPKDERTIWDSILKRAEWSRSECKAISRNQHHQLKNGTGLKDDRFSLPTLPEAGVANAVRKWTHTTSTSSETPKPVCKMPPSKSCHIDTFTIIIMAHNTERFAKVVTALSIMFSSLIDIGLTEIIFVWNASRSDLEGAAMKNANATKSQSKVSHAAARILQWDADPTNCFRIFYSLENGLTNNLLNRYHPSLLPKNDACVYFDDDGPFYTTDTNLIRSGIDLWKRNSDIQVGTYGRYLSFLSERINNHLRSRAVGQTLDGDTLASNNFIPLCLSAEGEKAKYNRDTFSDFGSSIVLPTGSVIHRSYFCFIWHPAFEELRQYVLTHPTLPDDMLVSILVAQLSGRGAKLYPRKEYSIKAKMKAAKDKRPNYIPAKNTSDTLLPNASHRRLLWEVSNWFEYRADAANSILGYFGTLHPGSIGWCKPTTSSVPYVCNLTHPSVESIHWMDTGGVEYHGCPLSNATYTSI